MTPESGPLILLVDDNLDTLEALEYSLRAARFRIETATDGRQAVEKARSVMPDVIVMDLAMPELDGWQATHQIKSNETTRSVPVIVCTGHAFMEAKEAARQAGCDVFLKKPVDPTLLVAEIGRVVQLARQTKAVGSRRPYELLLYVRPGSADEMLRVLDQLMGEFDSSLVRFEVREVSAGSPEATADDIGSEPSLLLRHEGSAPVRIACDPADVEQMGQRLRAAGLPRRRTD
jgi:two-component system cell cycle response regulator DivK